MKISQTQRGELFLYKTYKGNDVYSSTTTGSLIVVGGDVLDFFFRGNILTSGSTYYHMDITKDSGTATGYFFDTLIIATKGMALAATNRYIDVLAARYIIDIGGDIDFQMSLFGDGSHSSVNLQYMLTHYRRL